MSEFKVIETQEQFDAAIATRLERDRKTYAKQFEADLREKGWKSPEEIEDLTKDLNGQIGDLNGQIGKLQAAAADTEKLIAAKDEEIAKGTKYRSDLEKTRIVIGMGLPMEEAEKLRGENADEWKADAKATLKRFQEYAASMNRPSPLGTPESTGTGSTRDQFASWASDMFQT